MTDALVAVRLMQFASAMLLLGAPCFVLALTIACPGASEVRRQFELWLRGCLLVAALTALVSAVLWLDLEAGIMGDGWGRMLDPGTISGVLFDTLFGRAWCWHMGMAVVLLGVILWAPGATALIAALAAAHLASLAWAGHAVTRPGLLPIPVMAIHLLAAGLWLGSLPALYHLAALARGRGTAEARAALRRMLPLYSGAGIVAVGLVVLTGLFNSLFLVDSVAALLTTSFGDVLIVKIVLVLIMITIAADNRLVIQPRIIAVDEVRAVPISALWRQVALEQVVSMFVLVAVSLLGTLPPALTP